MLKRDVGTAKRYLDGKEIDTLNTFGHNLEADIAPMTTPKKKAANKPAALLRELPTALVRRRHDTSAWSFEPAAARNASSAASSLAEPARCPRQRPRAPT